MSSAVLEGRGLTKTFRGGFGGRPGRALADMDVQLLRGETLGLMDPSGCGKSTLARLLLRLIPPDRCFLTDRMSPACMGGTCDLCAGGCS